VNIKKIVFGRGALKVVFILSSVLFLIGIFLPLMTVSKFIIISNTYSLVSGIMELLASGEVILFIVLLVFSIILPLAKIYVLRGLVFNTDISPSRYKKQLKLMHKYGRWAMLDVMVVALLVVAAKLGALASVKVEVGLYVFGASVLLVMYLTQRVYDLAQESSEVHK